MGFCEPNDPCYCCLAAEVEALRKQIQAVRDVCNGRRSDWVFCGDILDALEGP
jgi:hypothetical protein